MQASSDQEALMAYYYMDEDNKVRVTEIFDVTDGDKHSPAELEADSNLQLDDWDEPTWMAKHTLSDGKFTRLIFPLQ